MLKAKCFVILSQAAAQSKLYLAKASIQILIITALSLFHESRLLGYTKMNARIILDLYLYVSIDPEHGSTRAL